MAQKKRITLPDMPENYLECRDVRHAWRTAGWFRGQRRALRRVLECIRCSTQRIDEFKADGSERTILGYRHADGYLLAGDGRPTAIELRKAVISRIEKFHDKEELLW